MALIDDSSMSADHSKLFPRRSTGFVLAVLLSLVAIFPVYAQAPRSPTPASLSGVVQVETVARGLEHPWALEFLPDGRILVTERPGRLRIVARDGRLSKALDGVPRVFARGQGGLLDIALDPRFAENRLTIFPTRSPVITIPPARPRRGHALARRGSPRSR